MKSKPSKPKFAYVSFFASPAITDPLYKLQKYRSAFDFLFLLKDTFNIAVFDFIGVDASFEKDGVQFHYKKKANNSKWSLPVGMFRRLRNWNPDVIYIQGLGYNHYIAILRCFVSSNTKIIVQDHANKVPLGWKSNLFRWGDQYIDSYFFSSKQLAKPWVEQGLISSSEKIIECVEGSTHFKRNLTIEKEKDSFLWVGRLDRNKDPLLVLQAFSKYIEYNSHAKLTMFYEDETLLSEVTLFISKHRLQENIFLKGSLPNQELEPWYQRNEYFILASHKEGGPFSLIESMACGCIPILTEIPAFQAMINNGECGFLFPVGDLEALITILKSTKTLNSEEIRERVINQFQRSLSHEAIALKLKTASL